MVIAAKTAEPHPKLPGTIHSVAKEVEAAGGKALAIECDIRYEDQVKRAIDEAVARFGHLDVLVNNASAIWPRPILGAPHLCRAVCQRVAGGGWQRAECTVRQTRR